MLQEGDFLYFLRIRDIGRPSSKNILSNIENYLVGLWLGDGSSLTYNNKVRFVIEGNKETLEFLKENTILPQLS